MLDNLKVFWSQYGFAIRCAIGFAGIYKISEVVWCFASSRGRKNEPSIEADQQENPKPIANLIETGISNQTTDALKQLTSQITQLGERIEYGPSKERVVDKVTESLGREISAKILQEINKELVHSDNKIGTELKEMCEGIRSAVQKKPSISDLERIWAKLGMCQEKFSKFDEFQAEFRAWKESLKALEPPPVDSQEIDAELKKEFSEFKNATQAILDTRKAEWEDKIEKLKRESFQKIAEEFESAWENNSKELLDLRLAKCNGSKSYEERLEAIENWKTTLLPVLKAEDFVTTGKNDKAVERVHKPDGDYNDNIVFHWKLPGIKAKLLGLKQDIPITIATRSFYLGNNIKVTPVLVTCEAGETVLIELKFTNVSDNEPVVSLPFLHSRRYVLIDQSTESGLPDNIMLVDRAFFGMNSTEYMKMSNFHSCQLCQINFLMNNDKYVKDDAIMIDIYLEPLSYMSKAIAFNNGVLLWKIDNYSLKKQYEMEGGRLWYTSEPFKTSVDGYTMHVEVFLNGDEDLQGNYMSIYLQFILGEHDRELPLPFSCRVSFELVDQTDKGKNHFRVKDCIQFQKNRLSWGDPEFVSQGMAELPPYLMNDAIFIKTEVSVLDLETIKAFS